MYKRYLECLRTIEGDALLLHKLQELDIETKPSKNKLVRLDEEFASDSKSEYVPSEISAYNLVMIVNPNPIYEQVCQDFKY